jgi:predicted Holliday junction resolvase-like endonuclease
MAVIILAVLLGVLIGVLTCWLAVRRRLDRRAGDLAEQRRKKAVSEETTESLSRSRAVLRGQLIEHLVPMFEVATFPDPGDARFLGRPVDFIVFDGYGEVRAGRADRLAEIVFVDVKTGNSRLSHIERSIRDCVEGGRVRSVVVDRPAGGLG